MADPITTLPVPTKNIEELLEADAFNGSEWTEVVQNGNSRKAKVLPETDAEMLGAPKAQSPDPAVYDNRVATTEWVKGELDDLALTPDGPGVPTLPTITLRTTLAQDGSVVIVAVLGWTAPTPMLPRWSYDIRYTKDGADPDGRNVPENHANFRVESGAEYIFHVRTVSKDAKSGWLDFDPITPVKKAILPPAPTGLTANGQFKRTVLRWADPRVANPTYYDHYATRIYRATVNDFSSANFLDETGSTAFIDGDLPNDTDYWYWIVHVDTSRNSSNKHPSSNTAGVHAKTNRVTDDDTDNVAPGTPTNLVLTPRVERTDDGTLDINLIVTWDAPAGGGLGDKGEYIIWMQESISGNVHTAISPRDDRAIKLRNVRSNRTYDVKVRARKGGGQVGAWTSTVQITINKKADYNTAVPSGLVVTSEHKRNILTWDDLTGLDVLDYKCTKIYRSATNNFAAAVVIGRPRDNAFIDGKVGNQATFYYWIAHVDRSLNESPRYPAGPANNNGVTPGAAPKIIRGDVNDLAIDTDQMEYHSISAADRFNIPMQLIMHKSTGPFPGADFNWGGDGAGNKINFNVVCGKSEKIRNGNPTPVRITGTMSLILTAKDESSPADGRSEFIGKLVLQSKKWDQADSAFRNIPRFRGPNVRTSARGSANVGPDKTKNMAISCVHRVKDADIYQYRVVFTGYHRRGAGRDWTQCEVEMNSLLTMQYTRR